MKGLTVLIMMVFLLAACGTSGAEVKKEAKEEENSVLTLIDERALEYGASVYNVEVNKDAINEGEYLILITFNVNNKKDTSKQYDDLVMYSDDIAASLSKEYAEVNTVVAFWETVDKKGGILKRAYEKDSGEMFLSDEAKNNEYFMR